MTLRDLHQLGNVLRQQRAQTGMTLRELAEKSGLVPSTLSRLESGQIAEPRPSHLQKLAAALEIDVEELYARAGYIAPGALPALRTYLRAKYGIDDEAASRIEGFVEATRQTKQSPKEGQHDDSRDQDP